MNSDGPLRRVSVFIESLKVCACVGVAEKCKRKVTEENISTTEFLKAQLSDFNLKCRLKSFAILVTEIKRWCLH